MSKASSNTIRRAAEVVVQNDPILKSRDKKLLGHSADVGAKYYDRSGESIRCSFVVQNASGVYVEDEVTSELKRKRDEEDKKDREKNYNDAKRRLSEIKSRKFENCKLTSRRRMLGKDRQYLQEMFKIRFQGVKFPGSINSFRFL